MADTRYEELLAGCAREAIHVPEAVQPYGALIAVEPDGVVAVASTSVAEVLGTPVAPGTAMADGLGPELAERCLAADAPFEAVLPDGRVLDVAVHRTGSLSLVELEPVGAEPLPADRLIALQRSLWGARSLSQLLDALVEQVQALTGFDRVMAYRFDEDWNGEVVAEALAPGLEPYHGLRYPASDIPPQARELYRRNPSRLIADVEYVAAPLVHADPERTAPLDLSDASLRSVSPVHLQYLHNMGVRASMSLSVMVDGELWGLIACHHESGPHRPDPARRRAAASLAELGSALVVTVIEAEQLTDRLLVGERVSDLQDAINAAADPLDALVADARLLGLVDAVGAVVSVDGRMATLGDVPSPAQAALDAATLLGAGGRFGETDQILGASGALVGAMAIAIGEGGRSWIIWYRPEFVREIHWAGDPRGDEVVVEADGWTHLGPRRSFASFVESVTGRSRPWTVSERWAARELSAHVTTAMARRTHQRLATTTAVQRALMLDASVEATGFDVAVRYVPAHGDPIGGDWHDVFHLPDGSAAFVVGDAVGHGVEVAGIMAQVRNALRAYLVTEPSPAAALDRIGELVQQLLPGQMATAVVAVVDPESGRYRLASAGHLPPFRLGGTGVVPVEMETAPALGFRRASPSTFVTGTLAPGEGMVLFSDGMVEQRGTPVPEGLRALQAVLSLEPATDSGSLCERALANARTGAADDDLTVLAFLRST